jgi:hypothetical protein
MAQYPTSTPFKLPMKSTNTITDVSSSRRSLWSYRYTRFVSALCTSCMEEPHVLLQQGSSVVDALLSDSTFMPRAITRNPASEKALALKERGAQVALADVWDRESIKQAIAGCEGVFGVCQVRIPILVPQSLTV